MTKQITLPRLGETMENGKVSKWLIKENDTFTRGQIIAEIESDKTTIELPALENGKLLKIIVKENDETKVGSVLAIFEN